MNAHARVLLLFIKDILTTRMEVVGGMDRGWPAQASPDRYDDSESGEPCLGKRSKE